MSRYVEAHKRENQNGPGDGRPTGVQIVEDEGLVGKLGDKVMIVTGTSSGIGIETLRALHLTGATCFATVRSVPKGKPVVDEILASDPSNKAPIHLIEMSLDSLDSVRKAAEEILSKTSKINILINNAGIMATPEGKTKDGFELQLGTNHLGHFLFFELLKPTLLKSATEEFPSRVVSVSSIGHRSGEVRLHDLGFTEPGSYQPWAAYGQAKTANIYLANEIERRYGSQNLHATSLHPGGIFTGLQVHVMETMKKFDTPEIRKGMKSPGQGASTSVYAALSEEWKHKGGRYLSNCSEMGPADPNAQMQSGDEGYAPWAYDEEKAKELWEKSLALVGLKE